MAAGPELFFGLVGAAGTDLSAVGESIAAELRRMNYVPHIIRVSGLFSTGAPLPAHEDERIIGAMDQGDQLRRAAGRGDVAMLLSLAEIKQIRSEGGVGENEPLERHAYIIHSLKHPDELALLKRIYGKSLFVVSVYYSKENREKFLCERISRSHGQYDAQNFTATVNRIIDRDENDSANPFGQNVRETFPKADIFISAQVPDLLRSQIKRFLDLIFGHPFSTPTVEEYGMFHATAAALRSADLSRQVGAVIGNQDGEIVSAGCNEVPKQGGGAFWPVVGDAQGRDHRDHAIGYDSTARMKHEILSEVFERLCANGWLSEERAKEGTDALVNSALFADDAILKQARISNLIEFGRSVHAEMSALMDAARRGVSVKGCSLYTSTFPCHMCARHIISAGIKEVYYVDPYPKSMAKKLYKHEICVDDDTEADEDAVVFKPFIGVSPSRYFDLFEMGSRKDHRGYSQEWNPEDSEPRVEKFPTYFDAEDAQLKWLNDNRDKIFAERQ